MTTGEGPFAEDFYWVLHAGDGTGCVVPNHLAGEVDLLARLQRLQGFNNQAVIEASSSTEQAEFVCWQGSPGQGSIAGETPPGGAC